MAFALNALKTHGCGFNLLCRPDVSLHLPFLVSILSRFRVEDRNCDLDDFDTVFFKEQYRLPIRLRRTTPWAS